MLLNSDFKLPFIDKTQKFRFEFRAVFFFLNPCKVNGAFGFDDGKLCFL